MELKTHELLQLIAAERNRQQAIQKLLDEIKILELEIQLLESDLKS